MRLCVPSDMWYTAAWHTARSGKDRYLSSMVTQALLLINATAWSHSGPYYIMAQSVLPSTNSESEDAKQPRAILCSHLLSWDRKEPQAILYDPSKHALSTLSMTVPEGECWYSWLRKLGWFHAESSEKFEVHLPRWKNRVNIYVGEKAREGFIATIYLNWLGSAKNWQRRLRHNYTSLYVKGVKPEETSQTSSAWMGVWFWQFQYNDRWMQTPTGDEKDSDVIISEITIKAMCIREDWMTCLAQFRWNPVWTFVTTRWWCTSDGSGCRGMWHWCDPEY